MGIVVEDGLEENCTFGNVWAIEDWCIVFVETPSFVVNVEVDPANSVVWADVTDVKACSVVGVTEAVEGRVEDSWVVDESTTEDSGMGEIKSTNEQEQQENKTRKEENK